MSANQGTDNGRATPADGGRTAETPRGVPPPALPPLSAAQSVAAARDFADAMGRRRTIRDFATDPVPMDALRQAIRAAGTSPSGANVQPWRFVLVTDPARKAALRDGAEQEERRFYDVRASAEWLEALAPLGTDWRKPFLTDAPVVIAVFEVHRSALTPRPYYVKESVGIAVGLLLAALHLAGLATLTHTPSPMRWINEVLDRPEHERPFLLIPVGYPAVGAQVPDIERKSLSDILIEL